jgi:hypothetical protein
MKTKLLVLVLLVIAVPTGRILSQNLGDSGITLYTLSGVEIKQATLGDSLLVELNDSGFTALPSLYLNKLNIGQLQEYNGSAGWYILHLEDHYQNKSLRSVFQERNENRTTVTLGIGQDLNNIQFEIKDFIIVFDKYTDASRWYVGIPIVIVFLIILFFLTHSNFSILRDRIISDKNKEDQSEKKEKKIKKKTAPFSLARIQIFFWTIIVLLALFYIWWQKGEIPAITPQMLILLGISGGTFALASIMDNTAISKSAQEWQRNEISDGNFLIDIVSDQDGPSVHRLQNVLFTIAVAGYFIHQIFTAYEMPVISDSLLYLLGISNGTYLFVKQSEFITSKGATSGKAPDSEALESK